MGKTVQAQGGLNLAHLRQGKSLAQQEHEWRRETVAAVAQCRADESIREGWNKFVELNNGRVHGRIKKEMIFAFEGAVFGLYENEQSFDTLLRLIEEMPLACDQAAVAKQFNLELLSRAFQVEDGRIRNEFGGDLSYEVLESSQQMIEEGREMNQDEADRLDEFYSNWDLEISLHDDPEYKETITEKMKRMDNYMYHLAESMMGDGRVGAACVVAAVAELDPNLEREEALTELLDELLAAARVSVAEQRSSVQE